MTKASSKYRLVILISGRGSNMRSIVQACHDGTINAEVSCIISNNPDAEGMLFAQEQGILTKSINHRLFSSRSTFEKKLIEEIEVFKPDLVVLAGFMRILTSEFVSRYENRLLNIHPSLLPKYPGLDTHQRALDNHDEQHGASVHFVTSDLDSGPVIIQGIVDIESKETADRLAAKVLEQEHKIYPLAIKWVLEGTISANGNQVFYNNSAIVKPANCYNHVITNPTTK